MDRLLKILGCIALTPIAILSAFWTVVMLSILFVAMTSIPVYLLKSGQPEVVAVGESQEPQKARKRAKRVTTERSMASRAEEIYQREKALQRKEAQSAQKVQAIKSVVTDENGRVVK